MPSLVITGHPCSGKTTFARLLASRALLIRHPSSSASASGSGSGSGSGGMTTIVSDVVHVRESTARPDATKRDCYSDSGAEKVTRAALKSEFDRAVITGKKNKTKHSSSANGGGGGGSGNSDGDGDGEGGGSTLVILDSLNYIKGYRYELHCISKAAGERHGVVWIAGGDDDSAKERNRERRRREESSSRSSSGRTNEDSDGDGYYEDDETMDALVLRYEPPDDRNRWEYPLYRVDVNGLLPWGENGTLHEVEVSSSDGDVVGTAALTHKIEAIQVTDAAPGSSSDDAPAKPPKKSASGFKRRGKKSTQPTSSTRHTPPSTIAATASPVNILSSIASRNLKQPGVVVDGVKGTVVSKREKIEDVIDGILHSFLTNVAPLREGKSTLNRASAESDALNAADGVTRRVNCEIPKAQKAAGLAATGVGGRIFVPLSTGGGGGGRRRAVDLPRPLYANELRDRRMQFLKWIAGHPLPDGTGEERTAEAYISYIESNI